MFCSVIKQDELKENFESLELILELKNNFTISESVLNSLVKGLFCAKNVWQLNTHIEKLRVCAADLFKFSIANNPNSVYLLWEFFTTEWWSSMKEYLKIMKLVMFNQSNKYELSFKLKYQFLKIILRNELFLKINFK